MRQIGTLSDETSADRFGDYLTTLDIANSVEESSSGWAVWVHDDDHLARASEELAKFQANPGSTVYDGVSKAAESARAEAERAAERRARNYYDVRTRWSGVASRARPVTIALIVISVIVGFATRLKPFDENTPMWETVSFASIKSIEAVKDPRKAYLKDLSNGDVWRLLTPIFLHMSILHLVFNMLWLADLGSMIEMRKGALLTAVLVLVSGIVANVVQNYWNGPFFGGMSGVVYALFGYCWMKGHYEPQEGIGMSQQTVTIMLVWLFACMTGFLGPVANAAHVTGLLVGVVFGQASTSWKRAKRKMRTG